MAGAAGALPTPGLTADPPSVPEGLLPLLDCSSLACFLENLLVGLCISECIGGGGG